MVYGGGQMAHIPWVDFVHGGIVGTGTPQYALVMVVAVLEECLVVWGCTGNPLVTWGETACHREEKVFYACMGVMVFFFALVACSPCRNQTKILVPCIQDRTSTWNSDK